MVGMRSVTGWVVVREFVRALWRYFKMVRSLYLALS